MSTGDGMRPRPPDGVHRPRQIHMGLSEAEAETLAAAAFADGKKVTWWLMDVGLAAARSRTRAELADAVDEAAKTVEQALPWGGVEADWSLAAIEDWSRLRAAALPAVLAEILKRPRKDT